MTNTRLLRGSAWVYAAGLALHSADHVRRGMDSVSAGVKIGGAITTIAGGIAIGLVLTRDRRGPLAAAMTGLPIALLVVAAHLLPDWGTFSDSFLGSTGNGVTAFSWLVVLIELAGAAVFGITGLRMHHALAK